MFFTLWLTVWLYTIGETLIKACLLDVCPELFGKEIYNDTFYITETHTIYRESKRIFLFSI